jgi:two-component system response regulator HydG
MSASSKYACNVLVVDDDADVLLAARVVLKKHFRTVFTTADPAHLPSLLAETSYDAVLLDMNYTAGLTSGQEGIDWLKTVQRVSPDTKVILMTAYGAVETAVKAMKEGAIDFVVKPWDNGKLVATVAAAARFSQAARAVRTLESKQRVLNEDIGHSPEIIGRSAAIERVLAEIDKVAPTDANVLIVGENGTGKELVARAIHRASPRAGETFVHVDLGAITESLFEAELFGHTKGAFTDAKEDRPGRFEIAAAGTLFLDEIGNLSMPMQSKLLGALETRAVSRVGSDAPIPIDARVICATNMAPEDMLDKRQFRQDLLYRINTVEISVPPLRQRRDDITRLVRHYVDKFAKKYGKQGLGVEAATLEKLAQYHWPGNVRELVHAVERAVIMSEDSSLSLAEFLVQKKREPADEEGALNLEALEKETIRRAIAKHGGNMSKAAQELGLGRTTLYRKIARHGL